MTRVMIHCSSGLTFVELLMAATIFSILMVGLSTHLRGGIVAWRRATVTIDELQQRRMALERLTQDLANGVVVETRPDSPVAFGPEALAFYTVQPVRGMSQDNARVWLVTYHLQQTAETKALVRQAQTIRQAQARLEPQTTQLLAHVERLTIRYGSLPEGNEPQIVWRTSWDDRSQFPQLLEMTVELNGPPILPRTIRAVVVAPSGSLKLTEAGP